MFQLWHEILKAWWDKNFQQLLPETEKRGIRGLIMQRPSGPPLPWVSSGWQTGYKKIPYLPVYPHFGQEVVSMIFFIFRIFCIFLSLCFCTFRTFVSRLCRLTTQGEAAKASPSLTREARRLPHCRGTLGISTCSWCLMSSEVFQLVLEILEILQRYFN